MSSRNQIGRKGVGVTKGPVMAKVKIDIGDGGTMTSMVTEEAIEDLRLQAGDSITATIKATGIIICKSEGSP